MYKSINNEPPRQGKIIMIAFTEYLGFSSGEIHALSRRLLNFLLIPEER